MKRNVLYLFNPIANGTKGQYVWQQFMRAHPDFIGPLYDVTQVANLRALIIEKKPPIVAVAGGDGSINRVCTAMVHLRPRPLLAIVPMGFGNALAYSLGITTIEQAIDNLLSSEDTVQIDIIKLNNTESPFGISNASIGYEAHIVHYHHRNRYIGIRSYVMSGVHSYFVHNNRDLVITIDNHITIDAHASTLVIANCPIIGKQYLVSHQAKLNDGYLDCTIFSSKFAYISNLRLKGFQHPFYSTKGKIHFKAKRVQVYGEPYLQVDGNPLYHNGVLDLEIVPHAVSVIYNKASYKRHAYSSLL